MVLLVTPRYLQKILKCFSKHLQRLVSITDIQQIINTFDFRHQFTSTQHIKTTSLTPTFWSLHFHTPRPVFHILLQAWSLLFTKSVTDVSWPISSSGRLLIEGLRPFLLQIEWWRLEDTKDMVVPCWPWQVLHRVLCGFIHNKYLKHKFVWNMRSLVSPAYA